MTIRKDGWMGRMDATNQTILFVDAQAAWKGSKAP